MIKFLCLLTFSCLCLGQNLLNIYQNEIPVLYLGKRQDRVNISAALDSLAVYNPELIADYIQYLTVKLKDSASAVLLHKNLLSKKKIYAARIRKWRENQIDIVLRNSVSTGQLISLWKYFYFSGGETNGESDTLNIHSYSDSNYKNYIVYLYYLKEYKNYDSAVNYDTLLNTLLSDLGSDFMSAYNNSDDLTDEESEHYISLAKNNHYFFSGMADHYISNPVPVHLSDFLIKISSKFYRQKILIYSGLHYDPLQLRDEQSFTYNDSMGLVVKPYIRDIGRSMAFAVLGSKIPLAEYKGFLSSIDFSVAAGYSSGVPGGFELNQSGSGYYTIYSGPESMRVDPNYQLVSVKNSSISFMVRLSVPVIFISSGFSFEAGAYLRYSADKYFFRISRMDEYYRRSPHFSQDRLVRYDKEIIFEDGTSAVHPLLALNYDLSRLITLRLLVSDEPWNPKGEILFRTAF